jgi:hypothetical protein
MATTTNFGWETPDDTDLVKDGAAAIRTALNGVDTSLVDLKGGTTGQILAKASNTDMDFVWSAPAAGGGMTLINTGGTALSGATTTVSSIPDTYKSLYVVVKGVSNTADVSNSFRFNGDTGNNYGYNWMRTVGETFSAGSLNATSNINSAFSASSSAAKQAGSMLLEIPRYADTDWVNFYWSSWSGADGTTTVNRQGVGVYDGTAAISSITFISNSSTFSAGTAYVYGVN